MHLEKKKIFTKTLKNKDPKIILQICTQSVVKIASPNAIFLYWIC